MERNQLNKPLTILAFCGSLRKNSFNRMALDALQVRSPAGVDIHISETLGDLPFFNPDLELALEKGRKQVFNVSDDSINALEKLRLELSKADGLIIASPEYAHGVTGLIKNTLDWLVSGESFINLPVMLVNTSARASHAQASLHEIIQTMSANIIDGTALTLPLLGSQVTSISQLLESDLVDQIDASLLFFCDKVITLKYS